MQKKIIIGCNDPDNREMLKMMFRFNGWAVITSPSLRAVVDMAAQSNPDIVLVEAWENGSLFNCRQFMTPLLFYSPVVVLMTKDQTREGLVQVRELGADEIVIAPHEIVARLPDRIRQIPARDKTPWA